MNHKPIFLKVEHSFNVLWGPEICHFYSCQIQQIKQTVSSLSLPHTPKAGNCRRRERWANDFYNGPKDKDSESLLHSFQRANCLALPLLETVKMQPQNRSSLDTIYTGRLPCVPQTVSSGESTAKACFKCTLCACSRTQNFTSRWDLWSINPTNYST